MTLWVGIVGPVAGLVGAWLVHLAAKRDSRRTSETDFRDDLIETIAAERAENSALRGENATLRAENATLREQIAALRGGHGQ